MVVIFVFVDGLMDPAPPVGPSVLYQHGPELAIICVLDEFVAAHASNKRARMSDFSPFPFADPRNSSQTFFFGLHRMPRRK